tara:strand:- start:44 stop:556 length:513 start_codon:yes stop_codon:yes gene_type:complete
MYPGGNLIKLSPSDLTATAYTEGDVIFAKAELKNAVPSRGGCSILRNVTAFVEGAVTADDLTLLFFDNSTDLGEPAADPASDITADEFRTASCIGKLHLNGGTNTLGVANGLLYSNEGIQNSANIGSSPLFVKAADGETSIWVAMIQPLGTLDLEDTDSITLTFGFEYIG